MIIINYGTSEHFEENIGDKIYCKSFVSAKVALKDKMLMDVYLKGMPTLKKEVIKQFNIWVFNKKTMFSVGCANISVGDLHIHIEEINLI